MSARLASLTIGLCIAATGAMAQGQDFSKVERGRALATVGDCVACHTAPGGEPFAGGRPIETPFGVLVSPNITPNNETGIGKWSDADFVRALREGIGRDSGHLYPACPYTYFTKVSTDDVLAIRAWMATLPPVRNKVDTNQLPFPLNIRADMIAWNALNFTPGRFQPATGKTDEWNRGAYLVQGLGHCGACHTAKTALGADEANVALQGGLLAGWFAPNIGGDTRRGVGGWSNDQVVAYLKTGHNEFAAAAGPMAEVVTKSTSQMPDTDLKAIAVYLRDQPSPPEVATAQPDAAAMKLGARIYATQCSACHISTGSGVSGLFPTLAHAPNVQSVNATTLIRAVLQGANSVATDGAPTGAAMPAFGWKLSDEQVAAVLNYVRSNWDNASPLVSTADVASVRKVLSAN
jgi:mono/diheme cytochrome c family protein